MPPARLSQPENPSSSPSLSIAYLISQYPTLSHSFILREIRELRKLGVEIATISVLNPDRSNPESLQPEEKIEFASTYYVRANWRSWPAAHLFTLLSRPSDYLGGFFLAIKSARGDAIRTLRHLRFFCEAVVVGRRTKQSNLDRLHTHFASLTAMLAKRIFGLRLSITIHGSDEFIDPVGFCMAEKLHWADLAIGISRYGCSQIMRFCDPSDWNKVRLVRLGIGLGDFQPQPRIASSAVFRVICVGRLVPVKAHRFLLRACAILLAEGESVQLTIIGGGPEKEPLAAYARSLNLHNLVEFTGPLPNDQVRDRLRSSDCFALASFAEGVPVVLMEAMALEVPCIATRVTGIPELIEDGVEGLLVPPADDASLAAAIRSLVCDPDLCLRVGRAGRAKVLRDYALEQNALELKRYLFFSRSSE